MNKRDQILAAQAVTFLLKKKAGITQRTPSAGEVRVW